LKQNRELSAKHFLLSVVAILICTTFVPAFALNLVLDDTTTYPDDVEIQCYKKVASDFVRYYDLGTRWMTWEPFDGFDKECYKDTNGYSPNFLKLELVRTTCQDAFDWGVTLGYCSKELGTL